MQAIVILVMSQYTVPEEREHRQFLTPERPTRPEVAALPSNGRPAAHRRVRRAPGAQAEASASRPCGARKSARGCSATMPLGLICWWVP